MTIRFFQRLKNDLVTINFIQVRYGHRLRGKAPTIARTLADRFEELNWQDPETSYRVNIGYTQPKLSRKTVLSEWVTTVKQLRKDPSTETKARKKELLVDLEKSKEDWWRLTGPSQIRIIAEHYGIFKHLFGDAYFTPMLPLFVDYPLEEDLFATVHRGNFIKPMEAIRTPKVKYEAPMDSLWTLLLTTPDGNFVEEDKEICHWFVGNIPGCRISDGDLLMDYMRPIPAYGIGYCRYVFVLYKQEKKIDYSEYKKEQPCLQLLDRNWSTLEFYRKYQDLITPISLAFFQADWDSSLSDYYRNTLGTREPRFEYDFPEPHLRKQEWFPKGKPFNIYLDKYRDPKDINKDFLLKKMKNVHPFRTLPPPLRFPNCHSHHPDVPTWLRLEIKKERLGWGRINEIN